MRMIDQLRDEINEEATSKRYRKNWDEEDYRVALDRSISAESAARIIGCASTTVKNERADWLFEIRDEEYETPGRDPGWYMRPVPDGFKRCMKCAKDLPVFEFFKDRHRADGRADKCRPCDREYRRRRAEMRKVYGTGE